MNSDGKPASPSPTSPLPVVTTGNPTGQDPSSNLGQPQGIGYIRQPNMLLGPVISSDRGIRSGRANMNAQVLRPSSMSYRKRVACRPQSSSIPVQRRRTLRAQPFIPPSIPATTREAPSVSNTSQTITHLTYTNRSRPPWSSPSFNPPFVPRFRRSALSTPTMPQRVPPFNYATPSLLPEAYASVSLPPHDKIASSFLPTSQSLPVPHEPQISQSLPLSRLRASVMSSAPEIARDDIQHIEPVGHKCFLCKRDLSYPPEGPISHSSIDSIQPTAAVLPCGHTFHDLCLNRMTSDEQSADPPCISCALGE